MHPLNLSMNNNTLTFLEWEIDNVLAHGAFDGYDLVDKLVKRAQLQKIQTHSLPKVVTYPYFPKRVRNFVKDYFHSELEQFPDLISHLGALKVFASDRPAHYESNVGAEYFDNANIIASYVPLEELFTKYAKGLVHEITHSIQFYLYNRGRKVATPRIDDSRYYSDNKFYLDDEAEVVARKAEASFDSLSWQVQNEDFSFLEFLNVAGPEQVWRTPSRMKRHPYFYLYTGKFEVTKLQKRTLEFKGGQWAKDINDVKQISPGHIGVSPIDGPFTLVEGELVSRSSIDSLSWMPQPDEESLPSYDINDLQAYSLYEQGTPLRAFTEEGDHILVHTEEGWELWIKKVSLITRLATHVFKDDEEAQEWLQSQAEQQRSLDASLKLSWQRDFIRLIEGLEEGQEIWDDGNDKFIIKEIDIDNSRVLLDEVFASGNFDGPFWVTEAEMLEYGFYKDPPTSRFRNPESSLKFSALSWQMQQQQEFKVGDIVRIIADVTKLSKINITRHALGAEGKIVDIYNQEISLSSWEEYKDDKLIYLKFTDGGVGAFPYHYGEEFLEIIPDTISSLKFSALKDKNEQLFNQRYQNYGEDGGNLFWSDKQSQYDRFELLTDIIDLKTSNKASILDVGMGFGDYLDFLRDYNITIGKYVGIDIIPAIIEVAERKHPLEQFEVRDLIREPYAENSFDYVIGSGLFALEDKDWLKETVSLLKVMYNVSRKAVAVNFLIGESLSDMFKTVSEEEIEKIASLITDKFKIIKDKISDDITLYLYKE